MKIHRGGFTYGRAPLGPHASCVHEVSRYGVHARRVRSQAHTANGSASYFHRRHKGHKGSLSEADWNSALLEILLCLRYRVLTEMKDRGCQRSACLSINKRAGD